MIGNAQTHCLQLPNTFAFARGAAGRPVTDADFASFANDLVPGQGALILKAWKTLAGTDSAMRAVAREVEQAAHGRWQPGRLRSLLLGSAQRFARDLILQLRAKAAYEDLRSASGGKGDACRLVGEFAKAVEPWQRQHGYPCVWRPTRWHWVEMDDVLARLHSPAIEAVQKPRYKSPLGFARVQEQFYLSKTHTLRLIAAMKLAAKGK